MTVQNADMIKPRLAIVFFAAKWFEEVVLGSDAVSSEFKAFLHEDIKVITDSLSHECTIVECQVVTSMEKARVAARKLLAEDVDAVLCCFIVWSEDEYLLPFRDVMKIKPSALWVYMPYEQPPDKSSVMNLYRNSGLIGTYEGNTVIRKMGVKVFTIIGSSKDEKTVSEIMRFARAAMIYRLLKTAKLAILPYRNDLMIACYVDEFRLYSQIGPYLDYISVLQLRNASDSVPDSKVREYVESIKSSYLIDKRVTEENLYMSARASLGMEKIMTERGIDGLALSDLTPELLEVIGLRPVLYPPDLARSERVVGIEGDLGCTTAMLILQRLTGNPVMFTEFFNVDFANNTIVAGHPGPENYLIASENSEITITPDYELVTSASNISGVWMEFIGKPGRVTLVNFICTVDSFQFTITGGESLGGPLRVEGYPHCYVKIDPDMRTFLAVSAQNGASHHWAIVHGDVRGELSYLADMLDVKKVML